MTSLSFIIYIQVKKVGYNRLVVPSEIGNPVIAFDVDLAHGQLVTGTIIGKVFAWRIDHVIDGYDLSFSPNEASKTFQNKEESKANSYPSSSSSSSSSSFLNNLFKRSCESIQADYKDEPNLEYICRLMSHGSDEQCRGIFFQPDPPNPNLSSSSSSSTPNEAKTTPPPSSGLFGSLQLDAPRVNAIIGDLGIKYWSNISSYSHKSIKVNRYHSRSICTETVTLLAKSDLMFFQSGGAKVYKLDIFTNLTEEIPFLIPRACKAIYYDQKSLLLLRTSASKRDIEIYDWASKQLTHTLSFTKVHKYYHSFVHSGSRVAHVCCHRKVKVWDLLPGNSKPVLRYKLTHHSAPIVGELSFFLYILLFQYFPIMMFLFIEVLFY